VPDACNGCGVVTCAVNTCCSAAVTFVLDTPLQSYRARPDLVTGFVMAATSVSAEFRFDAAGQRGNIGFDLASSTDIGLLLVDARESGAADVPYVGLETDQGARGCAYALVGSEADLSYPLFCWGTAFDPSETTRINVRVDSVAAGSAGLLVRAVSVD
jgi:hypothetical protein